MLSTLAALILVAVPAKSAPPAADLPPFTGELPILHDVARPAPPGGVRGGEFVQVVKPKGCAAGVAVDLSKLFHVSLNYVEKLQAWLDGNPGLEEKLFKGKGTLGEVSKLAAGARPAPERWCELDSVEGWKLTPNRAPPRACTRPSPRLDDSWWTHGGKPAVVMGVSPSAPGGADACAVRLSAVLFDQTGKARLQVHNDLISPPMFTLLGDNCHNVDFKFDEKTNGFKARPTPCKP